MGQLRCGAVGLCVRTVPGFFRFQPGNKRANAVAEWVPPSMERWVWTAAGQRLYAAILLEEREGDTVGKPESSSHR